MFIKRTGAIPLKMCARFVFLGCIVKNQLVWRYGLLILRILLIEDTESNCKKSTGVSLVKKMIVLFTVLLMFATNNLVSAKPPVPKEIKPYSADWYVTPEDIIRDIIFPAIDKRVIKEYGGKEASGFGWKQQRIVNIVYNNNHSYDISIRIHVPNSNNIPIGYAEDLVKVRVSPPCDSPKIGCSHDFKVEVLDYKHLNK